MSMTLVGQADDRRAIWRVATLNIWNRSGPWERRLPLIVDELRTLDLDVIGLQEVLGFGPENQARTIAESLGWNAYADGAWALGGGLTIGNAILSRHPILEPQTLALPSHSTDTRSVAFARLDCPHGPMPVFVTHLSYQAHLGHLRCRQVLALADHVAAHAPTGADAPPPVLLGDFNGDPDSDEMRFLRGLATLGGRSVYFADAWGTRTDPGFTYDRSNAYALRSREPSRRIDYVLVRGPDRHLRGEPLSARLAFVEPRDGVWPSDHYGVVAEIHAAIRPHDPF
jgi:endonuclease/exonuclease/phosphatase family metal-dependent hydrolase